MAAVYDCVWEEEPQAPESTYYNDGHNDDSNNYGSRNNYRAQTFTNSNRNNFVSRDSGGTGGGKTITVPTRSVGKIIGRAGATIKDIQAKSGAKVNISKEQSSDTTDIVLIGSDAAAENAEQLINDLLNSQSFGRQQNNRSEGFNNRDRSDGYNNRGSDGYNNRGSDGYNNRGSDGFNNRDGYNNRGRSDGFNNRGRSDDFNNRDRSNGFNRNRSDDFNNGSDGFNNSGTWDQPKKNDYGKSFGSNFASEPYKNDGPLLDFKKMNEECEKMEAEYWKSQGAVRKNFYDEVPEIRDMTPEMVAQFREDQNNIMVDRPLSTDKSKPIPNPVRTFQQAFHNYPEVLEVLMSHGFAAPTPIQTQAWPILLSGEDLIGIAQTGTGKTLAFLLPALIHTINQEVPIKERQGPTVLVLAPTRELAFQIEREVVKLNYQKLTSICICGGVDRHQQISKLRDGVEILIGTPGRVNDLVLAGHIKLTSISYVVLDEADKMLDMGFEPQIRKTLYKVRPDRQTVMTSATWPIGVRRLAETYTTDPAQVYIGSLDLATVTTVTQKLEFLQPNEDEKFATLMDFIANEIVPTKSKVIVFCAMKAKASFISGELIYKGTDCVCLHGDLEQSDRDQAVIDMVEGTVQILIATDIAARGIDIENITHVVNYDFPRNIEEYVHRVGRTGRAGRSGTAISYFTLKDSHHAAELIKIMEQADQVVPDELRRLARRHEARRASGEDRPRGFRRY